MKVYYDFETMLVKPDHAELKLEVLRKGRKSINHVLQKLKSTYCWYVSDIRYAKNV